MEKKDLLDALAEHGNAMEAKQAEMQEALEAKMSEQVEAYKKELSEMEETRKKMQEQLDTLDVELQKQAKKSVAKEVVTFAKDLKNKLTEQIEELAKFKGLPTGSGKSLLMNVKTFLETDNGSVTTGSLLPWPQLDPGVSKAPDRAPFMLEIVARGISNSLTVYWTQRKTRTDNTEWVGEGVAPAAQSVLGYETKSQEMQNLSQFIKVSNNSMDDIDWLLSEVQTELVTLMTLKLDADILNGTVAANGFDGVNTVATAFNAGGDTVQTGTVPNNYDVLTFAITQIRIENFEPNYILMNPADVRDMKLTRDGQGAYLIPPMMANGVEVDGIRIIANNGVTKGSYLVGDFTKAKFWTRKNMELRIWDQNETDAVAQLKTITLYMRGALVVKDADKLAFVKDTFAASITEITPA